VANLGNTFVMREKFLEKYVEGKQEEELKRKN
jgi:hypothetical protein